MTLSEIDSLLLTIYSHPKRVRIVKILINSDRPLVAREIHEILKNQEGEERNSLSSITRHLKKCGK